MTLASGIFKRHKGCFILDEDALRRIEGVLEKAAADYPEKLILRYHVEREDDRFYETHDISEVLADPNVDKRLINLIGVELRVAESNDVERHNDSDKVAWVVFDKDDSPFRAPDVLVRISSPHKTWALMLADELDPQVGRLFKIKSYPSWILVAYGLLAGLLGFQVAGDYAIQVPYVYLCGAAGALFFWLIYFMASFYVRAKEEPLWIKRYLMIQPVFLWGEEVTSFGHRDSVRKNLFWVVIVGFLVSLVAGITLIA